MAVYTNFPPPSGGNDPGTTVTLAVDGPSFTFSGLNSNTDGGYRFRGDIIGPDATTEQLNLQPGASTATNAQLGRITGTAAANATATPVYGLELAAPNMSQLICTQVGGATNRKHALISGEFLVLDGVIRHFNCRYIWLGASYAIVASPEWGMTHGIWTDTTNFTSIVFATVSGNNVLAGSWIRLQKMGWTA